MSVFDDEEDDDLDLPVRNLESHAAACKCPAGQVPGEAPETETTTEGPDDEVDGGADSAAITSVLAATMLSVARF